MADEEVIGRIEQLRNSVVQTVIQDFDYYRDHPKHLAWAMMNYQLVHRVGRQFFDDCWDNFWDPVIEAGRELANERDEGLLSDALHMSSSSYGEFPDTNPNLLLEERFDKTIEEWIALLTDKRYRNDFSDDRDVKDRLLCMGGTGYRWNDRGFIAELGSYGNDEIIFSGYSRAEGEVPERIKKRILKLRDDPLIKRFAFDYLRQAQRKAQRINAGEYWIDVIREEDPERRSLMPKPIERGLRKPVFIPYSLYESSNLIITPENAHVSYIKAGLEVAREIVSYDDALKEQKCANDFLKKEFEKSKMFARKFLEKWQKRN